MGYKERAQLTEAMRRRAYAVILFDEVGNTNPDGFNVMLQILDDGRVTDGQGRTVDFTNTILILTSNISSPSILDLAGDPASHGEKDAAAIGNAAARSISYFPREPCNFIYGKDSAWLMAYANKNMAFEDNGAYNLDARVLFHFGYILVSPAMAFTVAGNYDCVHRRL